MNTISQDILKAIAYFDYFNYPLTSADIQSFAPNRYAQPQIENTLEELVRDAFIFKIQDFYSLRNQATLANRRRRGNFLAIEQMALAAKAAKRLSAFPYVEAVAVSGSLSKYYADEKTDIDFFIITKANRLWIARTFMHLFKKLAYLRGRQHWYCMNYYVDECGLEIPEKNIFTAMEIVTLLPMQGLQYFNTFTRANTWTADFFPAYPIASNAGNKIKKGLMRICLEKILDSGAGDRLDKWLMTVTRKRWNKKTARGKLDAHKRRMGMLAGRHFSKPDPANFQAHVVREYENKTKELIATRLPVATLLKVV